MDKKARDFKDIYHENNLTQNECYNSNPFFNLKKICDLVKNGILQIETKIFFLLQSYFIVF